MNEERNTDLLNNKGKLTLYSSSSSNSADRNLIWPTLPTCVRVFILAFINIVSIIIFKTPFQTLLFLKFKIKISPSFHMYTVHTYEQHISCNVIYTSDNLTWIISNTMSAMPTFSESTKEGLKRHSAASKRSRPILITYIRYIHIVHTYIHYILVLAIMFVYISITTYIHLRIGITEVTYNRYTQNILI